MYPVTTSEQALAHLFFHFCQKDNGFNTDETGFIAGKFVELDIKMDFKNEVTIYKSYDSRVTDDKAYLEFLMQLIVPVNQLALFSVCTEICLSDGLLSSDEETMLDTVAPILKIETAQSETIKKLMIQRKAVQLSKLF